MFQHSATAPSRVAAFVSLLVAVTGIGMRSDPTFAGDLNWAIEGTWITTLGTGTDHITLTQTIMPLASVQNRFTSVMKQVNQNPTYFGVFPEADTATDWVGCIARPNPESYEGTFVSYLTRVPEPATGSPLLSQTVAILVLSGAWVLTGPDAWTGEVTIAAYRADQDADHDGLPDDGETPVDCSVLTHTGKRLGLMPRCTPAPPSETIDVVVDEEFVISLASNPSTGYSWGLANPLPAWLEFVGQTYESSQSDPPVIGGGGVEKWTFKATDAGTATVTFEYRRPWEKDKPPAQRKTFVIVATFANETVEVTVGQDFVISLQANHSTGFAWELANPLPVWLARVSCVYESVQTDPPVIGGAGVEKWTFRASAAGTAVITFQYRQPWATDVPPAQYKTFIIVARS